MKDGFYIYAYRHNDTLAFRTIEPMNKQDSLEFFWGTIKDSSYKIVELRSCFDNVLKTKQTLTRV